MILGVGVDICSVERIQKVLNKSGEQFLERVFRSEERKENLAEDPHHVARRYAAKEAVAKALGVGIGEQLSFKDIAVQREGNERPSVKVLKGKFAGITLHLSISDEKEFAVAYAVAESN